MTDSHAKSHVGAYVIIYISLLVLVIVTVAVAHVKTGAAAFPIAMAVAGLKTFLIVAVFMHLKDELPLIRVFGYIGVLWMGLFFAFLLSDYLTRSNTRAIPLNSEVAPPVATLHADPEAIHSAPAH